MSQRTHPTSTRRNIRTGHRRALTAAALPTLLIASLLGLTEMPAAASHFKSVEASVVVDGDAETATLTIVSTWTSSGSFSPSLTAPDGSSVSLTGTAGPSNAPVTSTSTDSGATTTQVNVYDLSGLTQSGQYKFYGSGNARVTLFKDQPNSGSFAFEVGFDYDPSDPGASTGPPTFSSTVRTNVAKGADFTQNLGAVDPDGGAITYSLLEDTSSPEYGADVTGYTLTGFDDPTDLVSLASDGTISIPGTVSTAILDTQGGSATQVYVALKVKATDATGEYVTRDITFNIQESSNSSPAFTSITSGQSVTVAAGASTTVSLTAEDATDTGDVLTLTATGLPSWATLGTASGSNPVTRVLTLAPPASTAAGTTAINVEATDDDGTFPLTAIATINLVVSASEAPAPSAPEPAPAQSPTGLLPQETPGSTSGSVGTEVVPPTPSVPTPGVAGFRVGQVDTRIDVTSSGAGSVDGSDDAPVLRATRDRVATISGGGLRPDEVAQVWLPLPDGGSRRVALLRVAEDGTFDGALPFTGELDGQGPLPIGDRTLQLYGVDASGQLTVLNVGVRIEQPGPLAPEPERTAGAPPTLAPGQSLATNAGVPEPVTVTPIPRARTTRVEGSGWLMEIDVPTGQVADQAGSPVIRVAARDDTEVRGTGFMPSTRAYVWLMSDPTFLGEVTVDADGTFEGDVPLAGIAPGEHTLQLSGVGTDGYVRAANLGVIVTGGPIPTRVDSGGGPLLPLSLVVTLALLAVGVVLSGRVRTVSSVTAGAEQHARNVTAQRRLPAFEVLAERLARIGQRPR